jgi:L-amino-acid oxidase
MNRKDFIKKLSITGTLFALAKSKPTFGQTEIKNEAKTPVKTASQKRAIVLGGGLSGLYSAYLLKQSGYQVSIVERGERLGGRISTYTDKTSGIVQDLGGEWIGEGQSDIKTLVKQLGLTLKNSPIASKFKLREDGGNSLIKVSPSSVETLEKVIDLHKSLGDSQKQGLDKINFSSYARYQGLAEDEVKSISEAYRILVGGELGQISSESLLYDLASQESSLRPEYYVSGGAEKLIQGLIQLLGNETEISLADQVLKVSQIKNSVQIELASGKVMKANLLVCTIPPQNVLDIKWTPSLPKDTVYSGLRMQSGRLSKNLILCKSKESFSPFLSLTDTPAQAIYLSGEEAVSTTNFALTSLTSGDRAVLFERATDNQRKALLKISLQELKQLESAEPIENGFIFHSFQKQTGQSGFVSLFPAGSFGIKDPWFEPYERVFFAGEHLARHSGTMDAAISSAIQAISRT